MHAARTKRTDGTRTKFIAKIVGQVWQRGHMEYHTFFGYNFEREEYKKRMWSYKKRMWSEDSGKKRDSLTTKRRLPHDKKGTLLTK